VLLTVKIYVEENWVLERPCHFKYIYFNETAFCVGEIFSDNRGQQFEKKSESLL